MEKSHILNEITRMASANNGIPLGRARFEAETGIKEKDWHGKYWARWGDAIIEAGFTPNELKSAFEDNHLLDKYARYVQVLGRIPTIGELGLKRQTDIGFPSAKTFARFGGKTDLIKKLLHYSLKQIGFEGVVQTCANYLSANNSSISEDIAPTEDVVIGYVYLIKSGKFYKIGKSNSVGRREYELAIQMPERAETIHVIRTDDPIGIEVYWHKRFAAKRKNGEWFQLNASDISAFKRRGFM